MPKVKPLALLKGGAVEFLLSYEAVRLASDPDAVLIEFLQTTYAAAADRGGSDRAALETTPPGGTAGGATTPCRSVVHVFCTGGSPDGASFPST